MPGSVSAGSILDGTNPLSENISLFLLQLAIIICLARALGYVLSFLRQPSVIAEVIGGIVLGPTLMGRIPGFTAAVFPPTSLPRLKLVADIGLILYLFLVGVELDLLKILKDFKKSAAISIAGIILPFGLGIGVASLIYSLYIDPSIPFSSFAVFSGVAMSITAFPVLARILTERKLLTTKVGQATIAAAASDDAIAWCLLILVVALINNPAHSINALFCFLIVITFGVLLWYTIRPLFIHLIQSSRSETGATQSNVFIVFLCMIVSSWFTQAVGVHAIFGAFMIGLIVPHDKGFAIAITEKIEDLVAILFLPLYFAYSGLGTHLDTLADAQSWGIVFLVIATACGGKIIGCTAAARMTKMPWRESFTIGFLMNTKGYAFIDEAGVITDKVYAIFLVMALTTTFMTVPIVSTIYPYSMYLNKDLIEHNQKTMESQITINSGNPGHSKDTLKLMICLPNMRTVPAMMNLTQMIFASNRQLDVYCLRLLELGERMSKVMMAAESVNTMQSDPVVNIFRTFGQLNKIPIKTLLTVSDYSQFAIDVNEAGSEIDTDLIIFPIESSPKTYPKGWAAQSAKELWLHSPCPVAFFVDRGFGVSSLSKLEEDPLAAYPGQNQTIFFLFYGSIDDVEALVLLNYIAHGQVGIVIYVVDKPADNTAEKKALDTLAIFPNVTIENASSKNPLALISRATLLGKKDLIVIGYQHYENGEGFKAWVDNSCHSSFVVVKCPCEVLGKKRGGGDGMDLRVSHDVKDNFGH